MTKPDVTFRYNKQRMRRTALIAFALAALFGLFGFAYGGIAVIATLVAALGVYTLILAYRDEPVLSIGSDGLRYARFSMRTIPWSEITAVAVVRGVQRSVAWGKVAYKHSPMTDAISFALRDYEGYAGVLRNAWRGVRTYFGLPGVECYVWHLDGATVDDIARAIQSHWHGAVQDMTPRAGRFESTPWTGTPPPLGQ
jgi:hypothetical protein